MVSRWTALAIQTNETEVVETVERCELWTKKEGVPHALVLSCPLDKRTDLERVVQEIKDTPTEDLLK